jgi:capsid protein
MWKSVKMYRSWLSNDFCQPIYEEWLCEAVARGRVNAPGFFADVAIRKAYSGSQWAGPAQIGLDPVKEVRAAQFRVENAFSTRDMEAQEMTGSDFYQNVTHRGTEEKLMKEVYDIERE